MALPKILAVAACALILATPVQAKTVANAPTPAAADPGPDLLIIKRQYKAAYAQYAKRAAQGDQAAALKMAAALRFGLGVEKDEAEAGKIYERLASAGNATAQAIVARMKIEVPPTVKKTALKPTDLSGNGIKGAVDFAGLPERGPDQAGWYQIAAAQKNAAAIAALQASADEHAPAVSAKLGDAQSLKAELTGTLALAPDNVGRTPVMLAVQSGNAESILAALDSHPATATQDAWGNTAPGLAATDCNADALAAMVKAGMVLQTSKEGQPAIVAAARNCNDWTALQIVLSGQDVNVVDRLGRSAAWYAAARGDVPLLTWLSAQGSNLGSADQEGLAPLHAAALGGRLDAIRFLLDKTNAPDPADKRGATPLMLAASRGCQDCIKLLLEKGASNDAKDSGGDTALMYAVRGLQWPTAQLLAKAGGNENAKSLAGDTPLKLAIRLGLLEAKK